MTPSPRTSGLVSGFGPALGIIVAGLAAIVVVVSVANDGDDREGSGSPTTLPPASSTPSTTETGTGTDPAALRDAVADCDVAAVEAELEKGLELEGGRFELSGDAEPSLDDAVECGPEMAALLTAFVVDNEGGDPVLQAAVRTGRPEIVTAVLDAGADVDAVDDAGDTALLQAASLRDEALVGLLLAAGADPNIAADSGHTPLWRAVALDAPGVVAALLDAGADPDVQADVSRLDLLAVQVEQYAREAEEREGTVVRPVDEVLAALGPELGLPAGSTAVDSPGISNVSALYLAVALSSDEVVVALLDAGADPTVGSGPGPDHHLPADAAELLGRTAIAERIRAAGG